MKTLLCSLLILGSISSVSAQIWQKLPEKPDSAKQRFGAFVFSIGNMIYYGGGAKEQDRTNGIPQWTFYCYNTESHEWLKKHDIPFPNIFSNSFSIDDKGYALVTVPWAIDPLTDSTTLWQYDTLSDSWKSLSQVPIRGLSTTETFVIDHNIFILADTTMFEYLPDSNEWIMKSSFPVILKQRASTYTIDNYGYIICWGVGVQPEQWRYDPMNDIWERRSSFIGEQRYDGIGFTINQHHRLQDLRDSLHILDSSFVKKLGCAGMGNLNTRLYSNLYFYDPDKDEWIDSTMFHDNFSGTGRGGAIVTTIADTAYIGEGFDGQGGIGIGNLFDDWWSVSLSEIHTVLSIHNSTLKDNIGFYPQLAHSDLYFTGLTDGIDCYVDVYDITGKKLIHSTVSSYNNVIDISKLPKGAYDMLLQQNTCSHIYHFIKY